MTSSEDYFTPNISSIDIEGENLSSEQEPPSSSATARVRPSLNKCIRRPRLERKMIRNLLARRYGSLHDFSKVVARWCDIARATGVHVDTVRKAVMLHHKRGNKFESDSVRNKNVGRPRTIPAELEAQLTSWETLNEMRFLSLPRRRELILR